MSWYDGYEAYFLYFTVMVVTTSKYTDKSKNNGVINRRLNMNLDYELINVAIKVTIIFHISVAFQSNVNHTLCKIGPSN